MTHIVETLSQGRQEVLMTGWRSSEANPLHDGHRCLQGYSTKLENKCSSVLGTPPVVGVEVTTLGANTKTGDNDVKGRNLLG